MNNEIPTWVIIMALLGAASMIAAVIMNWWCNRGGPDE